MNFTLKSTIFSAFCILNISAMFTFPDDNIAQFSFLILVKLSIGYHCLKVPFLSLNSLEKDKKQFFSENIFTSMSKDKDL